MGLCAFRVLGEKLFSPFNFFFLLSFFVCIVSFFIDFIDRICHDSEFLLPFFFHFFFSPQ